MSFTQGHALLIGVSTYRYAPHLNVPVTAADAAQLKAVLENPALCGYPSHQVSPLTDTSATRDAILAALDQLAAVGQDDTVLLFYAGHGDYTSAGGYCLTTHDTQLQGQTIEEGTGISQAELLQKLNAIPAKRLLVLFNACHSGQVAPTSLGGGAGQESFHARAGLAPHVAYLDPMAAESAPPAHPLSRQRARTPRPGQGDCAHLDPLRRPRLRLCRRANRAARRLRDPHLLCRGRAIAIWIARSWPTPSATKNVRSLT